MNLRNEFVYGCKDIKYNKHNSFINARTIRCFDRYEKLLGEGNYAVYSITEKIGGKKNYRLKHYWSLITRANLLNAHYENTKGEVNEEVER